MRTTFRMFVAALALMASACGAPAPNPSHPDGGLPPRDVVTPTDNGPAPDDAVVTPADTPTPADAPVTPGDVPAPPPDTTGPTNSDLPPGMMYNPGPGGNAGIPCQNHLNADFWGFPSGMGTIRGSIHFGEDEMFHLSVVSRDVLAEVNSWTYSVDSQGVGYFWNNFGRMPTGVHCRMRITDVSACDLAEFQCFAPGVDPRTGGAPMPDGTVRTGWISDI